MTIKLYTNQYGELRYTNGNITLDIGNMDTASFTVRKTPGEVRYRTWFGLELIQSGITVKLQLPEAYATIVEGLCGNLDGDKTDDYRLRNGTVLEYDHVDGYGRSDSEFKCAQAWMIKGDAGPHPDDVTCENKDEIEKICSETLSNGILEQCSSLIDFKPHLEACMVDYCLDQTDATLSTIIKNLVDECLSVTDDENLKCNWLFEFGFENDLVECPVNSEYQACASPCDQSTCPNQLLDLECNNELVSMCVCSEDFVLHNGQCVHENECPQELGDLSEWSVWSKCSDICDSEGFRERTRICLGPGLCDTDEPLVERQFDTCYEPDSDECIKCRNDNEEWFDCGSLCEPICGVAMDMCPDMCVSTCMCTDGFIRDEDGICISIDECDARLSCGLHEVRIGETCECKTGFERDEQGFCRLALICGAFEIFNGCGSKCEPVCGQEATICASSCGEPTCDCIKGYIRHPNGQCIPEDDCVSTPECNGAGEILVGDYCDCEDGYERHPAGFCQVIPTCTEHEIYIDFECRCKEDHWIDGIGCVGIKCDKFEQYNGCGSKCEPVCGEEPSICAAVCGEPTCDCIDGYIRHPNGECIPKDECDIPITCPDNEVKVNNVCECKGIFILFNISTFPVKKRKKRNFRLRWLRT